MKPKKASVGRRLQAWGEDILVMDRWEIFENVHASNVMAHHISTWWNGQKSQQIIIEVDELFDPDELGITGVVGSGAVEGSVAMKNVKADDVETDVAVVQTNVDKEKSVCNVSGAALSWKAGDWRAWRWRRRWNQM